MHDDSAGWLILSDMARRLERSDSTVRNWRKVYRDLIPTRRSATGQTLYPVALFERIRQMAEQRQTPREIKASLGQEAEPESPPVTVADVVALMAEHNRLLAGLSAQIGELSGLIRELLNRR